MTGSEEQIGPTEEEILPSFEDLPEGEQRQYRDLVVSRELNPQRQVQRGYEVFSAALIALHSKKEGSVPVLARISSTPRGSRILSIATLDASSDSAMGEVNLYRQRFGNVLNNKSFNTAELEAQALEIIDGIAGGEIMKGVSTIKYKMPESKPMPGLIGRLVDKAKTWRGGKK